mgnify:CR=1 FL=1
MQNQNSDESIFKSHEKLFNYKYLNYPLNSISSLFYILPIQKIYSHNEYSYNNLYGLLILGLLTISSFFWWASSLKWIQYWDLFAVLSVKIWILSNILDEYKLNIFSLIFIYNPKKSLIKYSAIILTILILYFGRNSNGSKLFTISILGKLSDTYFKYEYGTTIFHILSAIAIYQNLEINN